MGVGCGLISVVRLGPLPLEDVDRPDNGLDVQLPGAQALGRVQSARGQLVLDARLAQLECEQPQFEGEEVLPLLRGSPFPCACQRDVRGLACQEPSLLSSTTELGDILRGKIQRTEIQDGYPSNVFNGQEQKAHSRSHPTHDFVDVEQRGS